MAAPNSTEQPLVLLLTATRTLVERHGQDGVLRDGVAKLILGTRELLNAEWGRIDRGTVDRMLCQWAARIDFDLDVEEFKD
jgi:hypothetical protein